jgi:ureidoacrylate peracid hydrolase
VTTHTAVGVSEYAHMLLKVSDLEASQEFYVNLLGFTVRKAKPLPDGRPFVPFKEGLALTNGGVRNSPQIDHIAFKATGIPEIAARLRLANVRFQQDLHHGLYGLTIYVFDPDGNVIELFDENVTTPAAQTR